MTTPLAPDPRPAPAAALDLARTGLAEYWDCFWYRADHAPLETRGDVLLIIRRLRQHGSAAAWDFAYQLEQCL